MIRQRNLPSGPGEDSRHPSSYADLRLGPDARPSLRITIAETEKVITKAGIHCSSRVILSGWPQSGQGHR